MKKVAIICVSILVSIGGYFALELQHGSKVIFNPFEFETEKVLDESEIGRLKRVNYPIQSFRDAITIVMLSSKVSEIVSGYKANRLSEYPWVALAEKTAADTWTVVFREKGKKANLACWSQVVHSTAEPTPLKCQSKKQ